MSVCPHCGLSHETRSSGEAQLIARKSSQEIESLLGYVDEPEIIHRDNLILLD